MADTKNYVYIGAILLLLGGTTYTFIDHDGNSVSWQPVYTTCIDQKNIYEYETIEMPGYFNETNNSYSPPYNITTGEIVGQENTSYICGKQLGVLINNTFIPNGYIYNNSLFVCKISLGDRNFTKAPIKKYELESGVCVESEI